MIVLSTQIKVVSRFCESAIFNTQILFKKHAFQFQFQFVSFPQNNNLASYLQGISRKICIFFSSFYVGPLFYRFGPPLPRVLVANQPVTDHRGFNEPDIHHQAAMNPWHAAAVWPEVERVARNYGVQTLVSALMAFGKETETFETRWLVGWGGLFC